jgi:hypothetical protein
VDPDGVPNALCDAAVFGTIQGALDSDCAQGGALIEVVAGRYPEALVVSNPDIHLRALNPGVHVVTDAPVGVDITGDHSVVEGLTITASTVGVRLACDEGCQLLDSVIQLASSEPLVHGVVIDGLPADGGALQARGVRVRGCDITAITDAAAGEARAITVGGSVDLRLAQNQILVRGPAMARGVVLRDAIRPEVRGNLVNDLVGATALWLEITGGVAAASLHNRVVAMNSANAQLMDIADHPGFRSSHSQFLEEGAVGMPVAIRLGAGSVLSRFEHLTFAGGTRIGQVFDLETDASMTGSHLLVANAHDLVRNAAGNPPEAARFDHTMSLLHGTPERRLAVFAPSVTFTGPNDELNDPVDAGDASRGCALEPANGSGVCRLDIGAAGGTPAGGVREETTHSVRDAWSDCECGVADDHVEWTCVRGQCVAARCEAGWLDVDGAAGCEAGVQPLTLDVPMVEPPSLGARLGQLQANTMVLVKAGRYRGPLVVSGSNITLRAVDGPVVLMGGGDSPVLTITGDNARVEGFVISTGADESVNTGVHLSGCVRCAFSDGAVQRLRGENLIGVHLQQTDGAEIARSWAWGLTSTGGASPRALVAEDSPNLVLRDLVLGGLRYTGVFLYGAGAGHGAALHACDAALLTGVRVGNLSGNARECGCAPVHGEGAYGLAVHGSANVRTEHTITSGFNNVMGLGERDEVGLLLSDARDFESHNDLHYGVRHLIAARTAHVRLEGGSNATVERMTVYGGPAAFVVEDGVLSVRNSVVVSDGGPAFVNRTPFSDRLTVQDTVIHGVDPPGDDVEADDSVQVLDPAFSPVMGTFGLCLGVGSAAIDTAQGLDCQYEPTVDEPCAPDPGFCGGTPRARARPADE